MPPRKFCEASFFLIDLHSINIDELKDCASKIIGYKALLKTTTKNLDVIKIGFIGSNTTENPLEYDNINVPSDWQYYTLDVIKDVHNEGTGKPGNIYEALHLAANCLETDLIVKTNAPKTIVLFSDLSRESSHTPKDIKRLQSSFKNSDVWLYVIGPKVKIPRLCTSEDILLWSRSVEPAENISDVFKNNFNTMKVVLHEGIITDVVTGPDLFLFYKPQLKPPYPWYSDMMIGSRLSLKVNLIKLMAESGRLKYPGESKPPVEFSFVDMDNGEIVPDPVAAYLIQGRIVVLSAEKEKMILEKKRMNEDKCFQLSFFVNKSDVSPLYFIGGTICSVVADVRKSGQWENSLDVLAQAMEKMNVAAVVKRVYAKGPQFSVTPFVMFTCPEHGPLCLLASKWPFEKDFACTDANVKIKDKPLKTDNDEIKSAVDEYLTSLTVDEEYCDDGRVLYCLSENLQREPNMMDQIDYYVKCLRKNNFSVYDPEMDDDDPKDAEEKINEMCYKPGRAVDELMMHPVLIERSGEYLIKLNELCNKTSGDDDPKQCSTS